MVDYLNDKEQEERLRKLAKQYGGLALLAVAVVLAVIYGQRYWQAKKVSDAQQAAAALETVQTAYDSASLGEEADQTAFLSGVADLQEAYPDSAQAFWAQLLKAQFWVSQPDQLAKAQRTLQVAADSVKDPGLKSVAQLRLASVQIAMDQHEQALSTLNQVTLDSFAPTKLELEGDVYMAQDKTAEAQKAYEQSWELLKQRKETRPALRYKMQSLGLNPEPIGEPEWLAQDSAATS